MGIHEEDDPLFNEEHPSLKYLGKGFPFNLTGLPEEVARYLSDHRDAFVEMSKILWEAAEKSSEYEDADDLLREIIVGEKGFWEKLFG